MAGIIAFTARNRAATSVAFGVGAWYLGAIFLNQVAEPMAGLSDEGIGAKTAVWALIAPISVVTHEGAAALLDLPGNDKRMLKYITIGSAAATCLDALNIGWLESGGAYNSSPAGLNQVAGSLLCAVSGLLTYTLFRTWRSLELDDKQAALGQKQTA